MSFLRRLLSVGSRPCPLPPGFGRAVRMNGSMASVRQQFASGHLTHRTVLMPISVPTSPVIGGKKLFNDDGPRYMPQDWEPPQPTHELPEGWFVDENGFYTIALPAVKPTKEHYREADCKAFPHPLFVYRLALDQSCFERFKMNAYWVGLRLHHVMGEHIPGFWDVQNYKDPFDHKVIRLIFKSQGEIVFYGTHSRAPAADDGATLVVIGEDSSRRVLLYNSPGAASSEICYPEHRDLKYPAFELPNKETEKALISVYAAVAAVPSALAAAQG